LEEGRDLGFPNESGGKEEILTNLQAYHAQYKLNGFERVRRLLHGDLEFTIDNGLTTPSMKPNGWRILKKFAEQIIELYRN
jgi:long-chain acyl-CoA synthetase